MYLCDKFTSSFMKPHPNFIMNFLFNLLTNSGIFSSCFKEKSSVFESLPEDLVYKILVEYLPDQPGNRLVCKRVRNGLDDKYDEIVKHKRNRELINLEALISLKSGTGSLSLHDSITLLKCNNVNSRLVIRLMKENNWRLSPESARKLSTRDIKRIFSEARGSLDEYNRIARIVFNYRNFKNMAELSNRLDPQIIRDYEILRIRREEMYFICYSIIHRSR